MVLRPTLRNAFIRLAVCLGLTTSLTAAHAQQGPPTAVNGLAITAQATLNETARPAPNQNLHLTFSLKGARIADLEAFIATQHDPNSPKYHKWLKPDEVGTRFGASDADITAVVNYAKSQHLTTNVWPNHMFVSVAGTVAQVENAFQITIHGYNRPAAMNSVGQSPTFFAPSTNPMVPASIAARVDAIFGLTNALQMHARQQGGNPLPGQTPFGQGPINPPAGGGGTGSTPQFSQPLAPADVTQVYDFTGLHNLGFTGTGYRIGIFSPTEVSDSDIQTFCSYWGLSTPSITHVKVDGGATDYSGEIEACLDAEVILGQAPNINVVFYESPNNGNLDVWNKIVSDDDAVISNSWAYDESGLINGGDTSIIVSLNNIFATMDTQGQAHYNASGDGGSSPNGAPSVDFPGSSPHVTSVGGTSLYGDANGNYLSENGWSGSGGGLSIYFTLPSWQIGPGVNNSFSDGYRQMPDIASIADPSNPGYYVYSAGNWYQVGGTSAAAPLWAVSNQLTNQWLVSLLGTGHRTGVLNADLYGLGSAYGSSAPGSTLFCFHDSTTGSNGAYSCTPNWDYVTGWGSADFTKFAADYLQNYQGQAFVDLYPYNPGGTWTSPLVIHQSTSNLTEPTTFLSTVTYNIAACTANSGIADALPNNFSVQIDGTDHKFDWGAQATGYYYYNTNLLTCKFTAGRHTLKLIANVDGTIKESNTSNNVYSRTITVITPTPALSGVAVNPTTVSPGQNAVGTVTLTYPALTGGAKVTLASSNTTVATVPTSVTVPAGATTKTFLITTLDVTAKSTANIEATFNGVTDKATITVQPVTLTSLAFAPATVQGGLSSILTITLSGPAPSSGATVTLTNNNTADATVPTSITIPAGAVSISLSIPTTLVNANVTAKVTGKYAFVSQSTTLTITP